MTSRSAEDRSAQTFGRGGPLDRIAHARAQHGSSEVVRYDRQGRWYEEHISGQRTRLKTVHEAVSRALEIEAEGGEVLTGRPGGGRFDSMIEAARQRKARGR